jgi:L-histidine N-alpha-methyltransferase
VTPVHMPGFSVERHLPPDFLDRALRSDAQRGLTASPKQLPPKWFYDKHGSALFEEITRLPEYYPTRAERSILVQRAAEIAAAAKSATVVELGSGSSEKTRLLLDAIREQGTLRRYVAVDVSDAALLDAGPALTRDYPELEVRALVADFEHHLDVLPDDGEPRLVAFLGGTIGNFEPEPRAAFLAQVRATMRPGDMLLLGTDLVKSPDVLVAAYDDAAGVTAEFNRNVLHVLNRELGADFAVERFAHVAVWDAEHEWIEMRLRAEGPQRVQIDALDLAVAFADGEQLRTEISAKFQRRGVERELAVAGLALRAWWTDAEGRFAASLSEPACSGSDRVRPALGVIGELGGDSLVEPATDGEKHAEAKPDRAGDDSGQVHEGYRKVRAGAILAGSAGPEASRPGVPH